MSPRKPRQTVSVPSETPRQLSPFAEDDSQGDTFADVGSKHAPAWIMRTRDVRKTYWSGEVETPVLRGVNLDIRRGELLAVLGESGSGKTTLMNLIGGIDRADSGSMRFANIELTGLAESDLTEFRRQHVGFVFQLYNLVPTLTAEENVWAAAELSDNPMDPAEALRLVGLDDRRDYFPSQLSGGQQQRVAIARALAKRPTLLLCDEPTGALDHTTSVSVLNTLRRLCHETGTTMIMITHSRAMTQFCDRVVTIIDGVIEGRHTNPTAPQGVVVSNKKASSNEEQSSPQQSDSTKAEADKETWDSDSTHREKEKAPSTDIPLEEDLVEEESVQPSLEDDDTPPNSEDATPAADSEAESQTQSESPTEIDQDSQSIVDKIKKKRRRKRHRRPRGKPSNQ